MDFIDVAGASGASYRFRRVDPDALPPMGGNVVVVESTASPQRYLLCGAARSLYRAASRVDAALKASTASRLYIRLNVARTTREAEHADIVAAVQPDADLPDLD